MLDADDNHPNGDRFDSPPLQAPSTQEPLTDLLLDDDDDEHMTSSKLRLDDSHVSPVQAVAKVNETANSSSSSSGSSPRVYEKDWTLTITIDHFEKRGEGINAYLVYKILTEARNVPGISDRTHEVWRRFSDFLGLHEKLVDKFLRRGIVVPSPPEKSLAAMTKTKSGNNDQSINNNIGTERSRQLQRFLLRVVQHPKMRTDCDVRDFLTMSSELPKASNTATLSSAGVKRLFKSVSEAFTKIAFHMEEGDRWFEQTQSHVEELEELLRKLLSLAENLHQQRKELHGSCESLSKAVSMLASCEESTALARALSHLAETEENVAGCFGRQAENDQAKLVESVGEYVALFQSLKDVFNERVRLWQAWQAAQQNLTRKREQKARFELAGRTDKAQQAKDEMDDAERKVDQLELDFGDLSRLVRDEVGRFDAQRREDLKEIIIEFLESLLSEQQDLLKAWERFAPETAAIIL